MENKDLSIFGKGTFEEINEDFVCEGLEALSFVSQVQKKYNKLDNDSFLNELHDSIVGRYLGFTHANTEKHGFDCKYEKHGQIAFLESKVATWSTKGITATFNDTTLEKAEAFKDEKVWLALSVWSTAVEPMFICFGQNKELGEYLERRVREQTQKGVRRTQTLKLSQLILKYGFSLLAITKRPEEIYALLTLSKNGLRKMDRNCIIDLKDFTPVTEKYAA